jgi:hypothetical protein
MAPSRSQRYLMSILLDFCLFNFTVFVTIPTIVELSMWMRVGGCGSPNSFKVSSIIFASLAFKKRVPSSAFTAEAATRCRIVLMIWMDSLRWIGSLSRGILPRK